MAENTCSKCGCWKPICKCNGNTGPKAHVWKPMWYTDICEKPLYIETRKQLKKACNEHGVKAVRLM